MKKTYSHLTFEQRDLLSILLAQGRKKTDIAKELGCHRSTIYYEIDKNGPPIRKGYYRGYKAHGRAVLRNSISHQRKRLKNKRIKKYVISKIKLGWSPEQIAGRIKMDYPKQKISYEAIYQYIYCDAQELIPYLPRRHKKRYPKGHSRKHRKAHILLRTPIDKRPKHVEKRKQIGHWEGDTIVSKQSIPSILILVERKIRYTYLTKVCRRTGTRVSSAIVRRLRSLPEQFRRTITFDNCSENANHLETNAALGTRSYFCRPYHSWEKGTVENTVGLVRRFLPKRTNFAHVSYATVKRIQNLLNNRPRKCLNYHTPQEALNSTVGLAC